MAQHFLLSSAARTLSLSVVARMTDEEARNVFQQIRWHDTKGAPYCPRCGCVKIWALTDRPRWKCAACGYKFSVTSGTIFADRKMPIRDILLAIAIFANGAKGHSALQLSRDLDCQYKTALVSAHKIRGALASMDTDASVGGKGKSVEIDGAYFGGYVKPSNQKENRRDLRLAQNKSGKRLVVVIARERNGRTLPFVSHTEAASIPTIRERVADGTVIYADEAIHWGALHAKYSRSGSTTRWPTAPRSPTRTWRKASSPASVALRSVSITGSLANTWHPMPLKWRGAKTTAAPPTASNTSK